MIWMVGKENGPKHIVMLMRNPTTHRYDLTCFCKRRRKDGTCQRVDAVRQKILADKAHLVRVVHPQVDERRFRLPEVTLLTEARKAGVAR